MNKPADLRFGIDLGGTKTEIIALEKNTGREVHRHRVVTDLRALHGDSSGVRGAAWLW